MKLLDVLFFFITAVSVQAVEPPTATIQAREPPSFNVFAVSTACAAEPRQQQKRDDSCTRMGHLTKGPNAHRALKAVSYQRCANECVCRPGPNGCGSFAFVPNGRGLGRGRCRLYEKHLDELPYEDGPSADGHIVRFADRSCYHKIVPKPSSTMTQNPKMARAAATAAPVKRDDVVGDVMAALAGI